MYNLILKYNIGLALKTKNIKIIIIKKKIILNMKEKDFEILKNLTDIELWVQATNGLANNGVFAKMRYFTYNNKYIKFHPSIYFNNYDTNQNLVLNQTTKKNLEILEKFNNIKKNEYYTEKKKLELKLELNRIFEEGRAYMVMPHLVDEEDVILGDPEQLIKNLNKTENIVTKFKFIQSFFVYFEFELYKHHPSKGLVKDKDYLTIKEYLKKNIDGFGEKTKENLEKLLEFNEKNERFLKNNNLSFLELLNKADINVEVKNYFLKIIENNTK